MPRLGVSGGKGRRIVKTAIRGSVHRLVQFVTRVYFRKIEVRGRPATSHGTAIFAGNHARYVRRATARWPPCVCSLSRSVLWAVA